MTIKKNQKLRIFTRNSTLINLKIKKTKSISAKIVTIAFSALIYDAISAEEMIHLKPENLFYYIFKTRHEHAAVCFDQSAIIQRLWLPVNSRKKLLTSIKEFAPGAIEKKSPPASIQKLVRETQQYFLGNNCNFNRFTCSLEGLSPFYRKVLEELRKVPFGTTITYKELAYCAGKPNGARAAGLAVAKNPFPLIYPCHRVIKSDGKIGGFSSGKGIVQKVEMLKLEGTEIIQITSEPQIKTPMILDQKSINKGIKYLCKKDRQLAIWIKKLPRFKLVTDNCTTPFQALLEAIIYQQLTGRAAKTIYKRVIDLFGNPKEISPLDLIRSEEDELRQTGVSGPKILAIKDLAEKALSGALPSLKKMKQMSDQQIISKLIQIRGIGKWTAEMLLIFRLGRADVLAIDDYGLKKGLAILRKRKDLPSSKELKKEGENFKPYRTIASWYLWRIAENSA